jgi:hypothetical protein
MLAAEIVTKRTEVRKPDILCCVQATLLGKGHDLPGCAIARLFPCRNNHRVHILGYVIRFR